MDFEMVSEKKNDFLKRKEIVARLSFGGKAIPSNADVQTLIASHAGVDKELVFVKRINGVYGSNEAKVFANIYESREGMLSLENALRPKKDKSAKPAEKKEEGK